MERCRVKTFVAATGEEMNVMLNSDGSPSYWPNLYSTQKLRNAGLSPKSPFGKSGVSESPEHERTHGEICHAA
mgnify:CR=1 FL=1